MKLKTFFTMAGLALMASCAPAYADEPVCGSSMTAYTSMQEGGMQRVVSGVDVHGSLLEIWVDEGGYWIALRTFDNGVSCFVTEGLFFTADGHLKPNL